MNFKKIMAIAIAFVFVFANTCFAVDIVTEFEDEESVKVVEGIGNESAVLEEAEPEEDAAFELMDYENGISIIAPATTISKAGGMLQLEAEIWEPEEGESVIWSIEQGSNYATISQTGLVTAKTNGTVVCKVHSTFDPAKIAYKTIVISIQTNVAEFSIGLMGTKCNIYSIDADGKEKPEGSYGIKNFPAGKELLLKAVPNSDYEFVYWRDISGKIISYDPVLKYTVSATDTLYAVGAPVESSDRAKIVTFRDMSGKVLVAGFTSAEIKVPSKPFTLGYTFYCWVSDGDMYNLSSGSVLDKSLIKKNTMFVAGYIKDSTEYTVSVTGANEEGGKYIYNDVVTFTHKEPEEGMRFAYWMRDGKIVSYDEEYKFFMGAYDTAVEAVFVTLDTPVAEVPIIVMSEPQVVDKNKISFVAERSLPERFELLSTGIILSSSSSNITLETTGILHAKANTLTNKGQYTVRKADVKSSETWYARGYMIYKDGENTITVYSDPVTGKLNK